jgi:hypothetical protein
MPQLSPNYDTQRAISDARLPKVYPWLQSLGYSRFEISSQFIDVTGSIDLTMMCRNVLYHTASRIQNFTPYIKKRGPTFTIRVARLSGAETEFTKVSRAIKDDGEYPKRYLHAYFEGNRVLCAGLISTKDLYAYLNTHLAVISDLQTRRAEDEAGWADFYYVSFEELQKAGIAFPHLNVL